MLGYSLFEAITELGQTHRKFSFYKYLCLKNIDMQELLDKFIRVRITNYDRAFIEQHILKSGLSISELFRSIIQDLRNSSRGTNKK
jgi:hypothetical protein